MGASLSKAAWFGSHPGSGETEVVPIPYHVPAASLPRPLPPVAEISSARDILKDRGGSKVVRLAPHYIVKYGALVKPSEGQNLLFVAQHTSVRVPRVYAIFRDSADDEPREAWRRTFIVMELVDGITLDEAWESMDEAGRASVACSLSAYMTELRALPSPGYYGSLGRGHVLDSTFWTGQGESTDPALRGPFDSEAALNEGMVRKYVHIVGINSRLDTKGDFYRRALPAVLRGHPPVFTHGDFQRKNVVVKKRPQRMLPDDDGAESRDRTTPTYDVCIVDWETAGWYPSYWEYCTAYCAFHWTDDWNVWIERIIEPYYAECPWMYQILNELWS